MNRARNNVATARRAKQLMSEQPGLDLSTAFLLARGEEDGAVIRDPQDVEAGGRRLMSEQGLAYRQAGTPPTGPRVDQQAVARLSEKGIHADGSARYYAQLKREVQQLTSRMGDEQRARDALAFSERREIPKSTPLHRAGPQAAGPEGCQGLIGRLLGHLRARTYVRQPGR